MLEIHADEDVRRSMSAMRIRVLGGVGPDARTTTFDETQAARELEWPVELGIVPEGGDNKVALDVLLGQLWRMAFDT